MKGGASHIRVEFNAVILIFVCPTPVRGGDRVEQYAGGGFFRDLRGQQIVHAAGTFRAGAGLFDLRMEAFGEFRSEGQSGLAIRRDEGGKKVFHTFCGSGRAVELSLGNRRAIHRERRTKKLAERPSRLRRWSDAP